MTASEKLASSVANAMVKQGADQDYSLDPATILMIIGIIKTLIDVFAECRKTAPQVVRSAQKPGIVEQIKLRFYVNSAVPDWKRARQVYAGLVERCRTLTVEEAEELLREAD